MRCVALLSGGTAGHVYPALAVADACQRTVPGAHIVFLGCGDLAARLIGRHGFSLIPIPGAPLLGVRAIGKAWAMIALCAGVARARRVFRARGVELVIGFGGHASAAALIAARMLGISTAIFEANAQPGLTNRVLSRAADRVYLGCAAAAAAFPSAATLVTGVPVRQAVAEVGRRRQVRPRGPRHVLVTGGSLGSPFLNHRAPELLGRVARSGVSLEVRHQTGAAAVIDRVRRAYEQAGVAAQVEVYIDDIATAYAWADFAICCAGAVTLAEVAAAALPALAVPLATASENHQAANEALLAAVAGGQWIREAEWNPARLARQLAGALSSPPPTRLPLDAAPDASAAIVADCLRLAGPRPPCG